MSMFIAITTRASERLSEYRVVLVSFALVLFCYALLEFIFKMTFILFMLTLVLCIPLFIPRALGYFLSWILTEQFLAGHPLRCKSICLYPWLDSDKIAVRITARDITFASKCLS